MAARKKGGGRDATPLWQWLLIVLAVAWIVRSLVAAPFSIPSGSMLPGLFVGDYLIVSKWPYGYSRASFLFGFPPLEGRFFSKLPERGDVIVFRGPQANDVIKRVVGLPGDRIEIRNGWIILNGKAVRQGAAEELRVTVSPNSPCRAMTPRQSGRDCIFQGRAELLNGKTYWVIDQGKNPPVDDFGPVRVPAGKLFVMGDNRDDSADSRVSPSLGGMGFVPMEAVVGRAEVTFWSTDGSAAWLNPISWFTALRADRIGDRH